MNFGRNRYTVIQKGTRIKTSSSLLMPVIPSKNQYQPLESLSKQYESLQTFSKMKFRKVSFNIHF
jgi:hypothetical protein